MSQYPSPPAAGFPQQPVGGYGGTPPAKGTNGFAIAGFIMSLIGCLSPIGLILSIVGLVKAKKVGGAGRGLAIAGIIIAILWLGVIVLFSSAILALLGMSKEERELARSFALDVSANQVEAAMARTTATVSRDDVTAAAAKLQPLGTVTDSTIMGFSGNANSGGQAWLIFGTLTFSNGKQVGYVSEVVAEGDARKVNGFVFTVDNATFGGGNKPDPNAKPGR